MNEYMMYMSKYDLYGDDRKKICRFAGSPHSKHGVLFVVDDEDDASPGEEANGVVNGVIFVGP